MTKIIKFGIEVSDDIYKRLVNRITCMRIKIRDDLEVRFPENVVSMDELSCSVEQVIEWLISVMVDCADEPNTYWHIDGIISTILDTRYETLCEYRETYEKKASEESRHVNEGGNM